MKVWLLFIAFGMGTAVAEPPPPQVLARFEGEEITIQTLREYTRQWPQLSGLLAVPVTGVRQVLDQYIEDQLLMREGERLGIQKPDHSAGGEAAYLNVLTQRLVTPCVEPTEAETKAFFEANPMQFATPPFARLRRISLNYDAKNRDALHQKLVELQDAIADSKTTFEAAVATYSEDPLTRDRRHGDLGFLAIDVQNPVRKLFATAPIGAVIGPIVEQNLISIYQITARRESIPGEYAVMKEKVRESAFNACRREHMRVVIDELKQRWPVEILIP